MTVPNAGRMARAIPGGCPVPSVTRSPVGDNGWVGAMPCACPALFDEKGQLPLQFDQVMAIAIAFHRVQQGEVRLREPVAYLLIGGVEVVAAVMGIFAIDQRKFQALASFVSDVERLLRFY